MRARPMALLDPDPAALRPATRTYLAAHGARQRKALGQFFTPRAVRQRLLDAVPLAPGLRVLDPGAGTGEFLLDVLEREPGARVAGWEIDPDLVRVCREEHGLTDVVVRDALAAPPPPEHDLVLGNPPYREIHGRPDLRARFAQVLSGRPNAFSMFVQVGLEALRPGGRLAFVVPPSMTNGAYFASLRRWILDRAEVEHLARIDDPCLFDGALQAVMVVVLRKGARSERHVFRADLGGRGPTPLFLEDPDALARALADAHTIHGLGLSIRTGRCVWNRRRADLRREPEPGCVPLLWAHNLTESGEVRWDPTHPRRPQYVMERRPDRGPAIVVNRVVGPVGRGAMRAALVPEGVEFVGENHVNVVRRAPGRADALVPWEEVLAGLRGERAARVVRLLTGNTQVSATELAHLVPVLSRR